MNNILIVFLVIIIVVLLFYTSYNNTITVPSFDYDKEVKQLKNQIKLYESSITRFIIKTDSLDHIVFELNKTNDSLELIKQNVKHVYHKIYIDINHASNKQLDSIIRTNW
jgi:hypothetical protein